MYDDDDDLKTPPLGKHADLFDDNDDDNPTADEIAAAQEGEGGPFIIPDTREVLGEDNGEEEVKDVFSTHETHDGGGG